MERGGKGAGSPVVGGGELGGGETGRSPGAQGGCDGGAAGGGMYGGSAVVQGQMRWALEFLLLHRKAVSCVAPKKPMPTATEKHICKSFAGYQFGEKFVEIFVAYSEHVTVTGLSAGRLAFAAATTLSKPACPTWLASMFSAAHCSSQASPACVHTCVQS